MSTRIQLSDRNVNQNVFFLNNIVTSGTYGATLAKSALTIVDSAGNSAFPLGSANFQGMMLPIGYQLNVTEVAGVVKPTEPTLALSSEYGFTIMQFNPYLGPTGAWATHNIYASTPQTGATPAAGYIATAWEQQILSLTDLHVTCSVTGGVLTVTAAAGYPQLIVNSARNGVTFGSGTTPVVGIGNNADMTANNGITNLPYSLFPGWGGATFHYDICMINYQDISGGQYQTILFVNINDANYANFKTSLVTDIFKVGGLAFAEQAVAVN